MPDGTIATGTVRLRVERTGSGYPIVLAHGLTATRIRLRGGTSTWTLAGVSMGAAATLRFALDNPQRVAALVQITPAHFVGLAPEVVEQPGQSPLAWRRAQLSRTISRFAAERGLIGPSRL